MDYPQFTEKVEDLLISPEFHKLEQSLILREPNIWRITGIENRENRINNFLAWLLNPKANHSFGDLFLKQLVMQALRTDAGRQYQLNPVEILMLDLSKAEVRTEHSFKNRRRCDIVVSASSVANKPNSGFLCFIENKIWNKESTNQTVDYYVSSFEDFPVEEYPNRIYLFLTPSDIPAQCENFISISYQEVLQALQVVEQRHQLTKTEQFLVQQFRENIVRGIAMDEKTRELARAIYERHEEVIKVIWQAGNDEEEEIFAPAINREWYEKSHFFNVGEKPDSGYKWDDYWKYGFICAGGGTSYRKIMERLEVGETIYAYVSKHGYVGLGKVTKKAVPFRNAILADGQHLANVPIQGKYNDSENDDICDWIVLIEWQYAVSKNEAVRQSPITISTACKIYAHRQEEVEQIKNKLTECSQQKAAKPR